MARQRDEEYRDILPGEADGVRSGSADVNAIARASTPPFDAAAHGGEQARGGRADVGRIADENDGGSP